MKLVCNRRIIELTIDELGAMLFMEMQMFHSSKLKLPRVLEEWIDGKDIIEVDKSTFARAIMLRGVLRNNTEAGDENGKY